MNNMIEMNGIISMHIHEGKSKREISKILRISRNTVDKYIKEYEMNLKALKESESDHEIRVHQQTLFGKPTYKRTKPNRSAFTNEMKKAMTEKPLLEGDCKMHRSKMINWKIIIL